MYSSGLKTGIYYIQLGNQEFTMKQFAVIGLLGLVLMSFDTFVGAHDVHAAKKGMCTDGASLAVEGNRAVCFKYVSSTKKLYKSYTPCFYPGVYKVGDEIPNGSNRGRDRCTAPLNAAVGPALPCPPGQALEIRRSKKDLCYTTGTQNSKKYFDLQLIN